MKNIFYKIIIPVSILFGQTQDQIKQAKQIIQRTGMSESQARNAAKTRGYTDKQIDAAIQKAKESEVNYKKPSTEIEKSNKNVQEQVKLQTTESTVNEAPLPTEESDLEIVDELKLEIESKIENDVNRLSYFGYDIFKRDPALFQATSVGAVDPDYLIGPGDEIIVMLWGETQFRQVLAVDREGFVFIPEIGQVFVNGLNLNLLESKLFKVFSQSYASLNPQGRTPTTFLDLSLGNLRPLRIQVLGEVAQPGAYTVSPSATLFSALYYFNGPTTFGSLRDIQLIRGGKKIASIDFYNYLLTGKTVGDVRLQLDDVIFIPKRGKTISIQGQVNRNAIFEIKENERFNQLLEMAGGLKNTAYLERAQIDRIVPFEERTAFWNDRVLEDFNIGLIIKDDQSLKLRDGDQIQIYSIMNMHKNDIYISGSAVSRPGRFELTQDMRVSDLVKEAGGLLNNVFLEKAHIIRVNEDNLREELISINLGEALAGNSSQNLELQWMDKIRVFSYAEMIPNYSVAIAGHVKNPGTYKLFEKMTMHDLIFEYGGFDDPLFRSQTFLNRADLIRFENNRINQTIIPFALDSVLSSKDSKHNLVLLPGDEIRVYAKKVFSNVKTITINGVVNVPGSYDLKTGMTMRDLILEAGGLNENVYRYRAEIARINPTNKNLDEYADVITFNIDGRHNLLNGDYDNGLKERVSDSLFSFQLRPYDLVYIRADPYFKSQKQVSVSGEVLYPGNYAILSPNEKITDILNRSGGLLSNAYPEASQYKRGGVTINVSLSEILKNPKSKLNFEVQNADEILIVPHPNIIMISGEVNTAGIHKYVPDKRLRYYLKLAGGLNPDADKNNIWIELPNGDSKKYNQWSLLSPKVIDGSSIVVGKEKEEEPFDRTEFAKELTAILANLAQAISVVVLASR